MTEGHVDPAGEQPDSAAPSAEASVEADADLAPPVDPAAAAEPDSVDGAAQATPEADELAVTKMALEERTADLQRLQAEYLNYKRRVDRDRDLLKENATYSALTPIIEVLDTIDRAREHGPLEDGLKAVAGQLERAVAGSGLTRFAEVGEAFDPNLHEALSHMGTDAEVEVTTIKVVATAGYRIGERVVRAAQVLVVDPA